MKNFLNKHKKTIGIIGAVTGTLVLGIVIGRRYELAKYVGKSVLSWKPNGSYITLEKAIEVLELNKDADTCFAILKDGKDISGIILNNSKVLFS
jgi:hypothetical protein